jgi:hypothetical protein
MYAIYVSARENAFPVYFSESREKLVELLDGCAKREGDYWNIEDDSDCPPFLTGYYNGGDYYDAWIKEIKLDTATVMLSQ